MSTILDDPEEFLREHRTQLKLLRSRLDEDDPAREVLDRLDHSLDGDEEGSS